MYSVLVTNKAEKQLNKFPKHIRAIILNKIFLIRNNPFRHLKKLEASNLWRLRIMDYRAIIDILISQKKIYVLSVRKRAKVYGK